MFQAFYIVFSREILNLGNPNTGEGQDVIQNFNSIVKMLVLIKKKKMLVLSLGIFLCISCIFFNVHQM